MMKSKINKGFTLMELMIAVAIIGIVGSIAYPQYGDYVIKTYRSDATVALYNMSALQERFYVQYNSYADSTNIAQVGGASTEDGLYTVSITSADATSYALKATPVAGKSQADDSECLAFTLSSTGSKGHTGSAAAVSDCW